MAFVCISQRKITEKSQKDTYPSPAHYTLDTSILSHQCAPFRSTSQNLSQEIPGPGQYNIAKPFITPKVSSYFCQNNVLFKINSNGSSPFISQTKRFNKSLTNVPGPASYEVNKEVHLKGGAQMYKKKMARNQYNVHASIPAKARELLSLLETKQQKQQDRSPGPGSYYNQKKQMVNSKAAVWAKDRVNRFSSLQPSDVGPGKYNIPKAIDKKHGLQKSSTYKSNTARTFMDSIIYDSQVQTIINYRKQNNYKSPLPAPGQYNPSSSAFKQPQYKPIKYQCFGSSTQRFAENSPNDNQKTAIFPKTESIGEKLSEQKNKLPFNSNTQRDDGFLNLKNQEQATPGPGYYLAADSLKIKRKQRGKEIQQFGSTITRIPAQTKIQDSVGPGYYHIDQNTIGMEHSRLGVGKQQSSFFKSRTRRNFSEHNSSILPQIGQYDLTYNDVAKRLERQKMHLQNLRRINVYKPPFETSDSRFPHYQEWILDEEIANPEQKKQKVKRMPQNLTIIKPNPGTSFSKQQRFSSNRKGGGSPGVGLYQYGQRWNIKSYNTRFNNA